MNKLSISSQAQAVIDSYFNLPLGGKKVACPYFMNIAKQRGGLRVMVGKGSVEEIVHEVMVWAKLKGFDLELASEQQIRKFMINRGIGIDCSGFVVYVLNGLMKAHSKPKIWRLLKYPSNSPVARFRRLLRPVENISAKTLTSDLNCQKIENFNDIKPGDLIRAKGRQKNAHHVAIITDVYYEGEQVKKFEYVHAHRFYEDQNGVRKGAVEIIDKSKSLKDQNWIDDYKGRNYMLEDLLVDYEDNGIRRLKALN